MWPEALLAIETGDADRLAAFDPDDRIVIGNLALIALDGNFHQIGPVGIRRRSLLVHQSNRGHPSSGARCAFNCHQGWYDHIDKRLKKMQNEKLDALDNIVDN